MKILKIADKIRNSSYIPVPKHLLHGKEYRELSIYNTFTEEDWNSLYCNKQK